MVKYCYDNKELLSIFRIDKSQKTAWVKINLVASNISEHFPYASICISSWFQMQSDNSWFECIEVTDVL